MTGVSSNHNNPWLYQNILLLGQSFELSGLASSLLERGALVQAQVLEKASDLYHLPIEQFTMVIVSTETDAQLHLGREISSLLQLADPTILIVFASQSVPLQVISGGQGVKSYDVLLSLSEKKTNLDILTDLVAR